MLEGRRLTDWVAFFQSYFAANHEYRDFDFNDYRTLLEQSFDRARERPSAPIYLGWGITSYCNLRCRHCLATGVGRNHVAPTEQLERVARQLVDARVYSVGISGGEPLLHKSSVLAVIRILKESGVCVELLTNGLMLDTSTARALESIMDPSVDLIQISLDGASSVTHDQQRGLVGAFDRTVRGIRNAVGTRIRTRLSSTITGINLADMTLLPELAKQLGVSELNINPVIPLGKGETERRRMDSYAYVDNIAKIWSGREAYGNSPRLTFSVPLEFLSEMAGITDLSTDDAHAPNDVFLPEENLQAGINDLGRVTPGTFLAYPEFSMGNVFEREFREIWTSAPVLLRHLRGTACQNCRFLGSCHGGNTAVTYERYGSIDHQDPTCLISSGLTAVQG